MVWPNINILFFKKRRRKCIKQLVEKLRKMSERGMPRPVHFDSEFDLNVNSECDLHHKVDRSVGKQFSKQGTPIASAWRVERAGRKTNGTVNLPPKLTPENK